MQLPTCQSSDFAVRDLRLNNLCATVSVLAVRDSLTETLDLGIYCTCRAKAPLAEMVVIS